MCILTFQKDTWWCFFVFFPNHFFGQFGLWKTGKTKRTYKFLVTSVIFIFFNALISKLKIFYFEKSMREKVQLLIPKWAEVIVGNFWLHCCLSLTGLAFIGGGCLAFWFFNSLYFD